MSKTLKNQLRSAVFGAFAERIDKHGPRRSGEDTSEKVASYSSKYQLLDRCNQFTAWMKAEHPDIRKISDVQSRHIQEFLDTKAGEGVSQKTLDTYRTDLTKVGKLSGEDWSVDRVVADHKGGAADRGAGSVISNEDFGKLLDYCKEHPSKSALAIRLEAQIGVRVSDIAYGVRIEQKPIGNYHLLHIRCKNGKYCDRKVTPEVEIIIQECYKKRIISSENNKINFPKDATINTYLRRTEDKLGIERHSFHDLRRRIAQDKYDDCRHSGLTRSESLKAVSLWLNHGENREGMLLKSYISNAW